MAIGEILSSTTLIPDTSDLPKPALPLIESSTRLPPYLGLVSFNVPNPLLKDDSRFVKDFDGDARTSVTSTYDQHFLNEIFIGQNLSLPINKENHEKFSLLMLHTSSRLLI